MVHIAFLLVLPVDQAVRSESHDISTLHKRHPYNEVKPIPILLICIHCKVPKEVAQNFKKDTRHNVAVLYIIGTFPRRSDCKNCWTASKNQQFKGFESSKGSLA